MGKKNVWKKYYMRILSNSEWREMNKIYEMSSHLISHCMLYMNFNVYPTRKCQVLDVKQIGALLDS